MKEGRKEERMKESGKEMKKQIKFIKCNNFIGSCWKC
jgi:hypothetical protein